MNHYVWMFISEGVTSFEKIPIPLISPEKGETYTLEWKVQDREYVRMGQSVLSYTSDSDGEYHSFSSPVPGYVRIDTSGQRFVHHSTTVGCIWYGNKFEQLPPHSLDWDLYFPEENVQGAYCFFSFQSEQTETLQKRVEEKRKRNESLRQTLSPNTSDSPQEAETSFLDTCTELLQRFPTLSESEKKEVSSGSALNLLFESYSILNELLVEQGHIQNYQLMTEDERRIHAIDTVDKLYQWKMHQAKQHSGTLPEDIHQEKLHLWDQLREAHLGQLETSDIHPPLSDSGSDE